MLRAFRSVEGPQSMTSYCSKSKRSCARIYLRPSAGRFRPGGNARQAGGGFQVTPNAFLNDGLMDVMAITDFQTRELGLVIQELQDFTNRENQFVHYRQLGPLRLEPGTGPGLRG